MVHREKREDKREFFRINFEAPVEFKAYASQDAAPAASTVKGSSQNISSSGILFQTQTVPPQISSILWMSLDLRTLQICREIEDRALIFNDGVLGKVVRVEEGAQNRYDVGVCFLTQDQKDSREVQKILSEISEP